MMASRKRVSGWWSASLLFVAVGTVSACGDEHPGTAEQPVATAAAAARAAAAQQPTLPAPGPLALLPRASGPRPARRPPIVRTMPNGRLMLTPQEPTDVTTLQRQPDGTFKRVCGAPSDDDRTALELARRNRGVAR